VSGSVEPTGDSRVDVLRSGSLELDLVRRTESRALTPSMHSSHDLNRPEAKRFRVKLTNLNISSQESHANSCEAYC
jgi:hypothetical protein